MKEALNIEVHGVVQGVGFRPFVYRMAQHHLLTGWVLNATSGVYIHAEGESKNLDDFILELSDNAPAAARVDEIDIKEVPLEDFDTFTIRYSEENEEAETTLVSPDLATCEACTQELFDPSDRRFHYPFINCTNCGPRFTIIEGLPYDRKNTSMKTFDMCPCCAHEYADPADRRFHAQPDACFECGPHISWRETGQDESETLWGTDVTTSDAIIEKAAALLREGGIVAVKGLGGFHLCCDATNPDALATLRERKHREGKAFAVMVKDVETARQYCEIDKAEEDFLTGSVRPIVLLKKKADATFAPGLADKLGELGVMLPYTPLQHLLLAAFDGMLVMTSGNHHDEPIQVDDAEAFAKLSTIADAFLGNNRPIQNRFDDSVVRVIKAGTAGDAVQVIRRARGYAPMPLKTPGCPDDQLIFACGPEQKNTFTLQRGNQAFVSQHIGDMENADVFEAWAGAKDHYEGLFAMAPTHLAADMHPEYLSSKWAVQQHEEKGTPLTKVQHHHAHVASVMAENGIQDAVLGVAFDGTGYGADGAIWGGEFLIANLQDYERFANFTYTALPGGSAAIKNPLRTAYSVLWNGDLLDHPGAQSVNDWLGEAGPLCGQMIERGINSPFTSSVGRLFDAAAAITGACTHPSYEGEAAIMFEAQMYGKEANEIIDAQETFDDERYHIDIVKNVATETSTAHDTSVLMLDPTPLFKAMLDDLSEGVELPLISLRFHLGFVTCIVQMCQLAQALYGITTVCLSGGVFMNRFLIENTIAQLEDAGFTVAINKDLPPNDGAISYGQAAVAAARM